MTLTSSEPTTTDGFELDLGRMRRERLAKLQSGLAEQGLDGLVLVGNSCVRYATGAELLNVEWARTAFEPVIAIVPAAGLPHLFTPYPEGAPPDLPADHVHPPLLVEYEEGVRALAGALGDILGADAHRIGFDELSPAELELLPGLRPGIELLDAGTVLGPAKVLKTPDEVECLRRSQRINDLAMYDVYESLRPGVRQCDLSSTFLQLIFELGASANMIDPIWEAMPRSIAEGPFTVHGDVAFPTAPTDQILRQDDVVMNDTGILYEGYCSDFGRTWIVGGEPTARQRDQFRRWRDVVQRVLDVTKPGATGRDLTRAAMEPGVGRKPWLEHFWLVHGCGTDSAEMPLLGTRLGEEFDESTVLAPGMIMVLEPVIWDDGYAGYRAEDTVVVTDDGYRRLSSFPYMPFDEGTWSW
jgi:Xaa-Pro aminopeptidase